MQDEVFDLDESCIIVENEPHAHCAGAIPKPKWNLDKENNTAFPDSQSFKVISTVSPCMIAREHERGRKKKSSFLAKGRASEETCWIRRSF